MHASPAYTETQLEALAGGEPAAFEQFYRDHHARIYNLVARVVGDPDDAADITQEVFLRAYTHPLQAGGDLRPEPWLYRIAVNASYDHLRRRAARPSTSLDTVAEIPDTGRRVRRRRARPLRRGLPGRPHAALSHRARAQGPARAVARRDRRGHGHPPGCRTRAAAQGPRVIPPRVPERRADRRRRRLHARPRRLPAGTARPGEPADASGVREPHAAGGLAGHVSTAPRRLRARRRATCALRRRSRRRGAGRSRTARPRRPHVHPWRRHGVSKSPSR